MIARTLICGLLASAAPVLATAESILKFPEGTSAGFTDKQLSSQFLLPIGPFSGGKVDSLMTDGTVEKLVWKTPVLGAKTKDLIAPLRDQLLADGYTVLFECEARECGGFDFRFETDVIAEPEMHVDLGDFRYLSAKKLTPEGEKFMGILVSRSLERGYVQVTSIGDTPPETSTVVVSTKRSGLATDLMTPESFVEQLTAHGAAVLEGLVFLKGAGELGGDDAESLRQLTDYLAAEPTRKVVLVGHTDAEGSLEGNIALSRKRAASVKQRLIETYGVNPEQVSSEGVGFLSPRASNETEEGREKNRRVEAVLTQ